MSAVVAPIIVGVVNGKPVRFFKTPLNDGKPDLPWHATDDLARALGCDRGLRKHYQRMFQKDWPHAIRSIATAEGVVTVAPHFAALGFVSSMIENGIAPQSADMEYARSAIEACQELFGRISNAEELLLMVTARNRWDDPEPGAAS